ncbi:MAG: hypothetical protein ACI9YG_001885, partial [Candidatus Azotimanducaceae bacterium]
TNARTDAYLRPVRQVCDECGNADTQPSEPIFWM